MVFLFFSLLIVVGMVVSDTIQRMGIYVIGVVNVCNRQLACACQRWWRGCIMSARLLGKKRKLLHLHLAFFLFNVFFQDPLNQKKSPLQQAIILLHLFLLCHQVRNSLINTISVLHSLVNNGNLPHLPIAFDVDDRIVQ